MITAEKSMDKSEKSVDDRIGIERCLDPGITGHGLALPKEEEGGASRANDVVQVEGCGWV